MRGGGGQRLTPAHSRPAEKPLYQSRFEVGPWFEAGRSVDGRSVQDHLTAARGPYCLYIHVPFCDKRCNFCALYTFVLGADREAGYERYLEMVSRSVASHPVGSRNQAPTTVHFGGGTPLTIGEERLAALTANLRSHFGDSEDCEWAIETTTSSIDRATASALAALGFRRIHLGIQTLDDDIRCRLGRRETARQALGKLTLLHEEGFFPSVDLIIGFDGYTVATLESDLDQLWREGIRMFSVCELRHRRPQIRDGSAEQRQIERNHACWRRLWEVLSDRGLRPIHLGQFGRSQRDNLYYTHPARREDCVALGPYSHGSCGRLYYANQLLPRYYRSVRAGEPAVKLAVLYDEEIQVCRDLESELLAHQVSRPTVAAFVALYPRAAATIEAWLEHGLLVEDGGGYALTCDGSWFVGNMVHHGRELASPSPGC